MPNESRRVGRPALNNVQHLYDLLAENYRNDRNVPLSDITSRFGWTDGTARAMISQVRHQMNVRIRFNRYNNSFRLVAPRSESAPAQNVQNVATVITARPVSESTDTLDVLMPIMMRETDCSEVVIRNWFHDRCRQNDYVTADQVSYGGYTEGTRARIRAFIARARATGYVVPLTPPPPPPPSPVDSLWRGIAPEVVSFYRERALDLRTS